MAPPPNIAFRKYEIFLRLADVILLLIAGFYLLSKAWLAAALILVLGFFVGMIGQALPHRKQQTMAELSAAAKVTFSDGELSDEGYFALSKATLSLTMVGIVACIVITWHAGFRWYWMLLAAVGTYFFCMFSPILFVYRKKAKRPIRD